MTREPYSATLPNGVLAMTLNTSYKTCMPASASQNHGGMRSTYVGCSHGRQLGIGVVRRCDLDDIGGHDVQPVEAPQNRPQLARGPTARLRCASRRRERRVNGVDLDKKTVPLGLSRASTKTMWQQHVRQWRGTLACLPRCHGFSL